MCFGRGGYVEEVVFNLVDARVACAWVELCDSVSVGQVVLALVDNEWFFCEHCGRHLAVEEGGLVVHDDVEHPEGWCGEEVSVH